MQEPGKGRSLPSYVTQLDVLALTTDLDQICRQLARTEVSSWFLYRPGTRSVHNMHFPLENLPERTQRKNILLQIIYVELYTRAKNTPFYAPPCGFVTFGILCKCLCLLQGVLWRSLCLLTCRSDREGCETSLGGWMCCQTPAPGALSTDTSARTPLRRVLSPAPGCCGHAPRKQKTGSFYKALPDRFVLCAGIALH